MSTAPQMSLDERERRARERAEERARRASGAPSPNPAEAALAAMRAPVEEKGFMPPKPGESLFDNYANLSDPLAFSTDEQEVEELLAMGVGQTSTSWENERYREAGWDSSPYKNPPAYLKKLRPVTREPWTIDGDIYNAASGMSDYGKPQRWGVDLFNMGNPVHEDEDKVDPRTRPKGVKQGWNSQPFRSVPYSLRGLRPASTATEPWVQDQKDRKGNFEDTDVLENETAIQLDNGGEARFKNFKNYEGRIGSSRVEPWDSSTKTW